MTQNTGHPSDPEFTASPGRLTKESFLEDMSVNQGKTNFIVGFDVSGSTVSRQLLFGKQVIAEMTRQLFVFLRGQKATKFRAAFFGSQNISMPKGFVLSEVYFLVDDVNMNAERVFLAEAMQHAQSNNLTCPHFLLDGVPLDWMHESSRARELRRKHGWADEPSFEFLLVTDGELYDGTMNGEVVRNRFAQSVQGFMGRFPHAGFSIISVDARASAASSSSAETVVGCDVFCALQKLGLTDRLRSFFTKTKQDDPNEPARELLSNRKPKPGYVTFGTTQMFRLEDEPLFHAYVASLVQGCTDLSIYTILRRVVTTVASYAKMVGLSQPLTASTAKSYRRLFQKFSPGPAFEADVGVDDVLECFDRQMQNVLSGHAELAVQYATDRKRRIAYANEQLTRSVREAVGAEGGWGMTLPINGQHVFVVPLSESLAKFQGFPVSGYADDSGRVEPVLPMQRRATEPTDQALRQYVRSICGHFFGLPPQVEQTKYLLLCYALAAFLSPEVSDEVRRAYASTATLMLRKTAPGSQKTELETIREGGTVSRTWEAELAAASIGAFGQAASGKTLPVWHGICRMVSWFLKDEFYAVNQFAKCGDQVPSADCDLERLLGAFVPKLTERRVASKSEHEYYCPIFLVETDQGGFAVRRHVVGQSGAVCSPKYVMCREAVDEMGQGLTCLYCRTRLDPEEYLEEVSRPTSSVAVLFPQRGVECMSLFARFAATSLTASPMKKVSGGMSNVVIQLRGVVGSGKSKAGLVLKQELERRGARVLIAGTDSKCVKLDEKNAVGPKSLMKQAVEQTKADIRRFLKTAGKKRQIIIVDTCGERLEGDGSCFGQALGPDWTTVTFTPNLDEKDMPGYFAWSLTNILQRTQQGQSSEPGGYWLNPESAGLGTCISVHRVKGQSLFADAYALSIPASMYPTSNVVRLLEADAERYRQVLAQRDLPSEVKAFLDDAGITS